MSVYSLAGLTPRVGPDVYLAPGCRVVGDVELGAEVSVWFNAVIRGDVQPIRIGARSNIQDQAAVHVTTRSYACHLGEDVTVGHGAVLHGCQIASRTLIGMGAVVLDGAEVGEESIVAAQSLVRVGFKVPPGTLVAGVPATVKRELTERERAEIIRSAKRYQVMARRYREELGET